MAATAERSERVELSEHGLQPTGRIYRNPTVAMLYTHALARNEGVLAEGGPLVVDTGAHTGRSPKDKFIVREPGSEDRVWWGDVNRELAEEKFHGLRDKVVAYLEQRPVLFVIDAFAGADPAHRIGVRVITDTAYHALFSKTLFIDPTEDELDEFEADALVLHAPELEAEPEEDGTRTGTFVALHPSRTEVLIGGTQYAGEIKKSIFTVMNDRLPLEGILPMHCSANVDDAGRVAVFFGLSGTGKTTLSADPERWLIGDDEHGWGNSGVFNIEGGCYAKVIRLSADAEPEIYKTTHTFGTILENVMVDERGVLDLDDDSKTENTRAAYKLEQISHALPEKRAGHPELDRHADRGRVRDPAADRAADACAGALLLPLRLHREARGDGDRRHRAAADVLDVLRRPVPAAASRSSMRACSARSSTAHDVTAWLVNTGWTGGQFGEGERMPIGATRALLARRAVRASSTASITAPTSSSGSTCRPGAGRRSRAARPARDVARPGRLRQQAPESCADVPRQLREVRGGCRARPSRQPARRV